MIRKSLPMRVRLGTLLLVATTLSGCAAIGTSISHHDLSVQTKMSDTIFLQAQPHQRKTIYVSLHNTSDQTLPEMNDLVVQALQSKGYRVVHNPAKASYILQANVLQIGEVSESAAKQMQIGSFGSALVGGATGAAAGAVLTHNAGGALVGGLIGGSTTTIANHLVKDVIYTMVTDVQIQQRLPEGVTAHSHTLSSAHQGSSTRETTTLSKTSNFTTYRTRVISVADKVHLKFNQAKPLLEQQLAHSLTGIF